MPEPLDADPQINYHEGMALDGIVLAAMASELDGLLTGGRISKIAMPEKDEVLITVKNNANTYRLLISAGASLPLIYLTDENKPSPLSAPGFCMLLRKYIGAAKILKISQPGLERILCFDLEHRDELGDLSEKKLIVELMGKYSNIIFTDRDHMIIDAIKHVPSHVSSLREVLPGKPWYLPEELSRRDPLSESREDFIRTMRGSARNLYQTIYTSYSGISPLIAGELCFRAGVDGDRTAEYTSGEELERLSLAFEEIMEDVRQHRFSPCILFRRSEPREFSALHLQSFASEEYTERSYDSCSRMLQTYYAVRDDMTRMRQKSAELRKLTNTALERAVRKYALQEKQLRDSEDREKYKVYGDLLNTYGYSLQGGESSFVCKNYYDEDREITIPLDATKSARENAQRYYEKYAKMRRTAEALTGEILKTQADIDHLESIAASLDLASGEADLNQIRQELSDFGYIKKHGTGKGGKTAKAQPLHFVSSDGFDIYVGKNNYQNEEITFRLASGNDWWFHAKGIPGSHVIVKSDRPGGELPDRTFEEAAALAAFYSSASGAEKVEVDYTQKKNLKRVAGAAPGFVIYHTNYSMSIRPSAAPGTSPEEAQADRS